MPQQLSLHNDDNDQTVKPDPSSTGELAQSEPAEPRRRRYRGRKSFLFGVLILLLALMSGSTTNFIPSNSMEPNLKPGDHILTLRRWLAYPLGSMPHRGDIIIFKLLTKRLDDGDRIAGVESDKSPNRPVSQILIKRVIAVGGDTVRLTGNDVYVNGKLLVESYRIIPVDDADPVDYGFADNEDFKVPKGQLFLLGDNRNTSDDSRFWGTLDAGDVIGRFVRVLYNEGKDGPNVLRDPEAQP